MLKSLNSFSKKSRSSNASSWNQKNHNLNNKHGVFTLGLTILSIILCEEDLSFLYKIHHDGKSSEYTHIEFDVRKLQEILN